MTEQDPPYNQVMRFRNGKMEKPTKEMTESLAKMTETLQQPINVPNMLVFLQEMRRYYKLCTGVEAFQITRCGRVSGADTRPAYKYDSYSVGSTHHPYWEDYDRLWAIPNIRKWWQYEFDVG